MSASNIRSAVLGRKVKLQWKVEIAGESGNFYGNQEDPGGSGLWIAWRWEREWAKSGEPNAFTTVDYSNGSSHIALEADLDATPPTVTTTPTIVSDPSGVLDGDALPTTGWSEVGAGTFTGQTESTASAIYGELDGSEQTYGTPPSPVASYTNVLSAISFNALADHAAGAYPTDLDAGMGDPDGTLSSAKAFAFKVITANGATHQKLRFKFRLLWAKIPVVIAYDVRTKAYSFNFADEWTETSDTESAASEVALNAANGWESDWIELTAGNGEIKGVTNVVVKAVPWHD